MTNEEIVKAARIRYLELFAGKVGGQNYPIEVKELALDCFVEGSRFGCKMALDVMKEEQEKTIAQVLKENGIV